LFPETKQTTAAPPIRPAYQRPGRRQHLRRGWTLLGDGGTDRIQGQCCRAVPARRVAPAPGSTTTWASNARCADFQGAPSELSQGNRSAGKKSKIPSATRNTTARDNRSDIPNHLHRDVCASAGADVTTEAKALYSAIVLGATGNVGGQIVRLLIKSSLCKK